MKLPELPFPSNLKMQAATFLVVVIWLSTAATSLAAQEEGNPLAKVLDLLDVLQGKVVKEGEVTEEAYHEYLQWCRNSVKDSGFAIESATKEKSELEAKIFELTAEIEECGSKTEELAAAIASNEGDLKSATTIRDKELAEFIKSEKELMEIVTALERAIMMLEKEMQKSPASFAQTYGNQKVPTVLQSLSLVTQAAAFSVNDEQTLLALAQADDEDLGAPAAAAYKSQSGGIVEVLEDMKEKADGQLSQLRKAEQTAKHNYEMLKSSLEEQIKADTKDMKEEKTAKAEAEESIAEAKGDLEVTNKELENSQQTLKTSRSSCMKTGADHEMTVTAREQELKVLAKAKKILIETTSGAVKQTYSLLQMSTVSKRQKLAESAKDEVVVLVKRLARLHHSAALAQLGSRIAAVLKYGLNNEGDPFSKVKSLIEDMITQLEAEARAESGEKAYCDKQLAMTGVKKDDLDDDISKLAVKMDQATSKTAKLKEQVQELESELAALTKLQAELDQIRQETHSEYMQAKKDLEQGLTGVRKALGLLREYYGGAAAALLQSGSKFVALLQQPAMPQKQSAAGGAGQSIISILELLETDFAENLAKEETEEEDAQREYEKTSQKNKMAKMLKDQDAKFKSQEIKSLGKALTELAADSESAETEHAAVVEYYEKIKERCIAKPETYEERRKRREAEIAGLQEALNMLESETAFLQRKRRRRMHAMD